MNILINLFFFPSRPNIFDFCISNILVSSTIIVDRYKLLTLIHFLEGEYYCRFRIMFYNYVNEVSTLKIIIISFKHFKRILITLLALETICMAFCFFNSFHAINIPILLIYSNSIIKNMLSLITNYVCCYVRTYNYKYVLKKKKK